MPISKKQNVKGKKLTGEQPAAGTRIPAALLASCLLLIASFVPLTATANEPMTSPNFRLDPNVSNSFGGFVESDSYQLLDSGGEAVIGLGDSPSYKLSSGYISQLEQAIEISVIPEGLMAYWPFNTGVGIQAYDVTPSDNHGVLGGNPTWTDGKVGRGALEFDGSNDYVAVPGFLSGSTDLTVSLWIRNDPGAGGNTDSWEYAIYTGPSAAQVGGADIWVGLLGSHHSDTGDIGVAFNGQWDVPQTGITPNPGQWHHVAATHDGDQVRVYVDGDLKVERSQGSFNYTGYTFHIGAHFNREGRAFGGDIDEVKVYDRALSADEILDEYNASSAGIPSALTLPRIGPGESQTVGAEAIVRTDAGGYNLTISQDGDLRVGDSGPTIPAFAGSISNPEAWSEGSSVGFGFTVTSAVQLPGKWGSSPNYNYAAIPDTATTFHSRDGLSGGFKEVTALEFRLGVGPTQASGIYSNRLGFTATIKP